jgi:hypothetical protein
MTLHRHRCIVDEVCEVSTNDVKVKNSVARHYDDYHDRGALSYALCLPTAPGTSGTGTARGRGIRTFLCGVFPSGDSVSRPQLSCCSSLCDVVSKRMLFLKKGMGILHALRATFHRRWGHTAMQRRLCRVNL